MPIDAFREFLGMHQQATTIAVGLKNPKQLNATHDELLRVTGNKYEVITWEKIISDVVRYIKNMYYVCIAMLAR